MTTRIDPRVASTIKRMFDVYHYRLECRFDKVGNDTHWQVSGSKKAQDLASNYEALLLRVLPLCTNDVGEVLKEAPALGLVRNADVVDIAKMVVVGADRLACSKDASNIDAKHEPALALLRKRIKELERNLHPSRRRMYSEEEYTEGRLRLSSLRISVQTLEREARETTQPDTSQDIDEAEAPFV